MVGATLYRILDTLLARIIRIILESFLIQAGIQDPRSKIAQESLPGILDLGSEIQARIKNDSKMIRMIRASKQLFWIFEGGALNHPNHFGIIFDSGPARIIRIILESCLIWAWIQDPRSKMSGRSSQ